MADNLLCIPNYPSVDYNEGVETFGYQLNEPTNQNSIKVHIVVEPTN